MDMKRSFFTLIELLVVIAIIAILAAILLPALSRARDTAGNAKCTSNLGQLGRLTQFYTDAYGGYLPLPSGNPAASDAEGYWYFLYRRHLENDRRSGGEMQLLSPFPGTIYACPSARVTKNSGDYTVIMTYTLNANISMTQANLNTLTSNTQRTKIERQKYPTQTFAMADSGRKRTGEWASATLNRERMTGLLRPAERTASGNTDLLDYGENEEMRHSGGRTLNILYLDGHVAKLQSGLKFNNYALTCWSGKK